MLIRVVKLGGRVQGDAALSPAIAESLRRPDTQMVIVHGGGDEVSALQRRLGREPRFVGGRRVTTAEDVEIVRMVLSGTANKRLVRELSAVGVAAVGLSGEDGGLLAARRLGDGSLGAVGEPVAADRRVLDALLSAGFVPVVSPLARDVDTGEGLNVNGDDAAAALAVAVGASELLLLADVPGVLDGRGAALAEIDLVGIERLVADGVATGGMSAKLEAARRALAGGVGRVRIGGLAALADDSSGTAITLTSEMV